MARLAQRPQVRADEVPHVSVYVVHFRRRRQPASLTARLTQRTLTQHEQAQSLPVFAVSALLPGAALHRRGGAWSIMARRSLHGIILPYVYALMRSFLLERIRRPRRAKALSSLTQNARPLLFIQETLSFSGPFAPYKPVSRNRGCSFTQSRNSLSVTPHLVSRPTPVAA